MESLGNSADNDVMVVRNLRVTRDFTTEGLRLAREGFLADSAPGI